MGMPSKILFVGFVNDSLHQELPAYFLSLHGFQVTYLGKGGLLDIEKLFQPQKNLNKIPISENNSNRLIYRVNQIIKLLKLRNKYDCIYVYSHGNVSTGYFGLLGFRGRVIYHTQDFLDPNIYKYRAKYEKLLTNRANLVVVNDKNRGFFLKTFYNLQKTPLVVRTFLPKNTPFCNYCQNIRNKWLKKANLHSIIGETYHFGLHLGSFHKLRCTETLLEAYSKLPHDFIIIFTGNKEGSDSDKLLRENILRYNLKQRVGILPKLDFKDLFQLTAQADVGFLLYNNNDIGNFYQCPGRLTQYIGSGVPVIGSNSPSLELIIKGHNLGMTCDSSNAKDIAEAIYKLGFPDIAIRKTLHDTFIKELSYEIDGKKLIDGIYSLF